MKIEYRLGNRKVSKYEWERGIQKQASDAAAEIMETTARRVRCPVHGTTPTRLTRTSGGIRVQGCCDALTRAVLASFR
jgi:hypothetical protein